MKAFIEVDAGTDKRPIFDEQTLKQTGIKKVYKPYPYAYGFLLNTISGDGDHLDCYVITSTPLTIGRTTDVEPIGMVESIEDGEEDHKILCKLTDEEILIDSEIENNIRNFGEHYFDHQPEKTVIVGKFLGHKDAIKLINSCKTNYREKKKLIDFRDHN